MDFSEIFRDQEKKTKRYVLILYYFIVTAIYTVYQIFFFNTIMNSSILSKVSLWDNFLLQFVLIYPIVLVMTFLDYLLIKLINQITPMHTSMYRHASSLFVSNILLCILLYFAFNFMVTEIFDVGIKQSLSYKTGLILNITANLPILLVLDLLFYFQAERNAIKVSEKSKRDMLMYQYNALRAQVNPHFLFNSLNVLSSLIYENQDQANKYTKALSQVYRQVLSVSKKPLNTLKEEMHFFRQYLFLMEIRFENGFKIDIAPIEEWEHHKLVAFSFQLLLENAFKHNISSAADPLLIYISVDENGVSFRNKISLRNDITRGEGIGLSFLNTQYDRYHKKLKIEEINDQFIVTIPFIE
ncbi:sensor histidine kinase [Chryseobacterium sp. PMSZPI]|uniref:sensor histidine kinase n=1 Tax=Chryseobacterium sp. PMSZPI TaxID=1033900 RepID=UPI000C32BF9C|nr:sensor histidine kinase [Chryseobacterium sp. PMSZPI]PKF76060.1 histidine kinase [Chryseobacterium sp. PMSZPI]